MRRVKVKKLKLPAGTTDKGLAEMFNQVINGDGVNPSISYPRYKRLRGLVEGVIKVCSLVANAPASPGWTESAPGRDDLRRFCDAARSDLDNFFTCDLGEFEWNLNLLDEEIKKKFATTYKSARESQTIVDCVSTCDALIIHKCDLVDMQSLNSRFIRTMSGIEWNPITFAPSINFKDIFVTPDLPQNVEKMMMMFLHKLYVFGKVIYEELQSPDIDVDRFVEFITSNIDVLRKRDGLSRCNEAFAKIRESTKMLKENFGGYYRQFVDTGDSTIIMQSFISDVSKSADVRPEVLRQFRTIISYCTKVAASQSTDPQLRAACAALRRATDALDRKYKNISGDGAPSGGDEEPSDSSEEEPEETPELIARRKAMNKSVDELAKEIDG